MQLTLRQLLRYYDRTLLDRWDHTATLYSITHTVLVFLHHALSKDSKLQVRTAEQCHPYRESTSPAGGGMAIKAENFTSLKGLFAGMASGKRGR